MTKPTRWTANAFSVHIVCGGYLSTASMSLSISKLSNKYFSYLAIGQPAVLVKKKTELVSWHLWYLCCTVKNTHTGISQICAVFKRNKCAEIGVWLLWLCGPVCSVCFALCNFSVPHFKQMPTLSARWQMTCCNSALTSTLILNEVLFEAQMLSGIS